ncbi:hypothetical protein A2125_02310 [Candidatus Woesebacteria bacterium GWB1_43_5]|uniref:SCP domain-containing protein n=1 Tax=Candidatus Woesebacteria bacterium GWB1_43_5 TaxID=1802474 RepID=A0A1F7WVD6_9BACT|nr:MAG: hypothetical protein A2125_02310 [Candidatus Woesebacteria bacterium GWB1_43_5]
MNGNWVDLVIIVFLIFFIFEARRAGFWVILIDFVSFFASLVIALRAYPAFSEVLKNNLSLARSVANALSFLLVAILSEAILGILLIKLVRRLPEKWIKNKYLKYASVFPAVGETFVLMAFFLTLIISFPIAPSVKNDISESKIGGFLVRKTTDLEARLSDVFGAIVEDSLTHLIVSPGSRESVPLTTESQRLALDESAEKEMFQKVNEERKKIGLNELAWRPEIVLIARLHAKDMWEKRYFGHVSPEGADVGGRLESSDIGYFVAGENLALSPTVEVAHTGLMNSEGHRKNILSKDFKRLGIGVVDNGVYGKMFVQVFTD